MQKNVGAGNHPLSLVALGLMKHKSTFLGFYQPSFVKGYNLHLHNSTETNIVLKAISFIRFTSHAGAK